MKRFWLRLTFDDVFRLRVYEAVVLAILAVAWAATLWPPVELHHVLYVIIGTVVACLVIRALERRAYWWRHWRDHDHFFDELRRRR